MTLSESRVTSSIRLAQIAAMLVMLVGGSVLVGWTLDIPMLKRVAPDLASMVPNTALSFLCLGIVLFQQARTAPEPSRTLVVPALLALVAGISGLTLLQYGSRLDFGIDQFLFLDDTRPTPAQLPGRMAPVTALCLMLSSLALGLGRHARLSTFFAVVVLFLGTLATTGYLFDVSSLYQVTGYTSVALHTAVSLVVLSLGTLASRPRQGMMPIILSDTAGGEMARRLLWMMPLVLVFLDWLVLQGELASFYDSRFGLAISTLSTMAASWGVILFIARQLHFADRQRQHALEQLAALNDSLERKVIERTKELTVANEKLAAEILERKQAEERVNRLSLTDDLSGLLNRRGFHLLAEQALKTARRVKTELTLVYIDLDGLKRINDELGHQAGDTMIVEAAHLLKVSFRESDLIARLGGDEFAVLAIGGSAPEVMLLRLQKSLELFNKESALTFPLSFSFGSVRCAPDDEKSLLELLAEADARMYLHKQAQRQARSARNGTA